MDSRIELRAASKSVGDRGARRFLWKGVNFSVSQGEIVALTGPSGSGKSTLLNCVGLLDTLDEGEILFGGQDVSGTSARGRMRLRRFDVGYLFQDYALIDNESVAQNVDIAVNRRRNRHELIQDALDAVGLAGRGKDPIYRLSGGEQQRVAMARILVRKPPIVLADEPTASLDRNNASAILLHLRRLADEGAGILLASHDPWVIGQCDRKEDLSEYA